MLSSVFSRQLSVNSLFSAINYSYSSFVPKHKPVCDYDVKQIKQFIERHTKILVLTGAGISTESGIPDYRSEGVGLYARSSSRPIQYQDFVRRVDMRKRYWARNYVGWSRFSSVNPNTAHYALKSLECKYHKINAIVTQNVDGLHQKAGSRSVVELHGSAYRVICLQCEFKIDRNSFQLILKRMNPNMQIIPQEMRPDGDVELPQDTVESFMVPQCPECKGILKPDIVFFGDNVPKERVHRVRKLVEESDALMVLGSSLSVFSGYRFVLQAHELKKPIAIINIGETRGDIHAHLKMHKKCGEVFSQLLTNVNES